MTMNTIRQLLRHRPFERFRIIISSGESYEICGPELALPIRNGIFIALGGGRKLPERAAYVLLLHIASIETPSNRARKRR